MRKTLIAAVALAALVATASAFAAVAAGGTHSAGQRSQLRVRLQPRVVQYRPARVSVSGLSGTEVSVRLGGANAPAGLAYRWAPYRWRRLRLVGTTWSGVLPAPPLFGIYQLQFRIEDRKRLLASPHWLVRVLPPGTLKGPAFPTPQAVIRHYVGKLPNNQVVVAARAWPQAAFDHRDPRLQRLFVIAYAPRGDNRPSARRGLFITTVRDGYHGKWRLLEATTEPYD